MIMFEVNIISKEWKIKGKEIFKNKHNFTISCIKFNYLNIFEIYFFNAFEILTCLMIKLFKFILL